MANDLTTFLLDGNNNSHAELSSDILELIGKRAANMYLEAKTPLNNGVAKLAMEYKNINSDQIKRIVEFANTQVYLAHHEGNKIAGVESSYPQFELADAEIIIQGLATGKPNTITKTAMDYSKQPKRKKTASAEVESEFTKMFYNTQQQTEKIASETLINSAASDLINAKYSAEDLRDTLAASYNQIDDLYKTASFEYYDLIKRYLMDDGDFSHVMAAARSTGCSDEKIAHIIKPAVEKLLLEKVASSKQLNQSVRNLEKVAFRVVNPEHPLVKTFSGLVLLGEEKLASWNALKDATIGYEKVAKVIKETFFAKTSK